MANTTENLRTHVMTAETMEDFILHAKNQGASDNKVRRLSCTVRALYGYLPEDKTVTKDRLLAWRKHMEANGYSSVTILNYVKYINCYLDFVGCSEIRFNKGKSKDIRGMVFGYLTALEPTAKRDRKDIVWRCQCKCGNTVELPATRLLLGNTLSCGCLQKEHLQRANIYIANTSLRQSLEENIKSTRSTSGYTGVTAKRGKWQSYITYKGKRHSLGIHTRIEDAIKARARAKELVQADAMGLLDFYKEIHKLDPALPSRDTEPTRDFLPTEWVTNDKLLSAAKRIDNSSGHTGVSLVRNRWQASICHKGIRYILGSFDMQEGAVNAREQAEHDLISDPDGFAEIYQKKYRYYAYAKK